MAQAAGITFVTLNLLNQHPSRWEERVELIRSQLAELDADVAVFQEVQQDPGSVHRIAEALGAGPDLELLHCRNPDPESIKSLAVVSTLPMVEGSCAWTEIGHRDIALRMGFDVGGRCVTVATTHLLYRPGKEGSAIRAEQAGALVEWLDELPPGPMIVAGDFNAAPSGQATAVMKERFRSVHEMVHGAEPEVTHPTPMIDDPRARPAGVDYIYVASGIDAVDCRVVFDRPASDDPTLYPSDHYGLVARLELT